MLIIKLQEAMRRYERFTGERMTYKTRAERTGIGASTLGAMGSRASYSTSTANIEKICIALHATPGDLLEIIPDLPRKSKKKKVSRKKVAKKR